MPHDTIFLAALQGGLLLGLIHGVNPCGHSWLVLAPFTAGSHDPGRVFRLTAAFITGTSLACLLIGLTLGGISMSLPASAQTWADVLTFGVLVVLGCILLVKPTLLHSHDHDGHDHAHDHDHDHGHDHDHAECGCHEHDHDHHHPLGHDHDHDHDHSHSHAPRLKSATAVGLFAFGFVNMIVPCPTAAIMYSYALRSGDAWRSSAVFGAYALGTGAALAGVIWAIYRTTNALRTLDRPWIEPLVMRLTGVLVIGFAIYSLWATESAVNAFPEFFA